MKSIYPKLIIGAMIVVVAFIFNFKYQYEPIMPAVQQQQQVKKVIVVKKVYIKVPVPSDTTRLDSNIITLPKQTPKLDYRKYYRSRNLHRSGSIS